MTPARLLRRLGAVAVVAVVLLVLAGLAPFALREPTSRGPVADTAADLPGQAQVLTTGLRELGYSCADPVRDPASVTRSCSRVRNIATSQVQFAAAAETGRLQVVRTTVDEPPRTGARLHGAVLGAAARAVGLPPAGTAQVQAAAAGEDEESVLRFGWGTVVVRTGAAGGAPDSTLRAADADGPGLRRSPTTLEVPVDTLATAAAAHGYTCTTPEVTTIRSCQRTVGGYRDDLWLQGTGTSTTSLQLSVSATYQRHTRGRWVGTMGEALGWVDTDQTRALRAWLAASSEAPGGDTYVGGLRLSFLVRDDTYGKETFGGVSADCAPTVDDLSSCEPG